MIGILHRECTAKEWRYTSMREESKFDRYNPEGLKMFKAKT
jgi:hypothetical protein